MATGKGSTKQLKKNVEAEQDPSLVNEVDADNAKDKSKLPGGDASAKRPQKDRQASSKKAANTRLNRRKEGIDPEDLAGGVAVERDEAGELEQAEREGEAEGDRTQAFVEKNDRDFDPEKDADTGDLTAQADAVAEKEVDPKAAAKEAEDEEDLDDAAVAEAEAADAAELGDGVEDDPAAVVRAVKAFRASIKGLSKAVEAADAAQLGNGVEVDPVAVDPEEDEEDEEEDAADDEELDAEAEAEDADAKASAKKEQPKKKPPSRGNKKRAAVTKDEQYAAGRKQASGKRQMKVKEDDPKNANKAAAQKRKGNAAPTNGKKAKAK